MHQDVLPIKRVLISVSNKEGIAEFAEQLATVGAEIFSTGKTHKLLEEKNVATRKVEELTQFPEIMGGRVKTLHPKIHGGILGRRDTDADIAKELGIDWIDMVIVNLYPFAEVIKNPNCTFETAIENIDIGGPTMIRSAAKNFQWVCVIVDPKDYVIVAQEIEERGGVSLKTRTYLAEKAFAHTAQYDQVIADYLIHREKQCDFPEEFHLHLERDIELRYGENPHQKAQAYHVRDAKTGILAAKQHQGKSLSYNNITDADAAWSCVCEWTTPACVIVKHANPCGVSTAENITQAFNQAYAADPLSAFGGIIALNKPCTKEIAEALSQIFVEVIIAPAYESEALKIFSTKPNLRLLEIHSLPLAKQELKFIEGGLLIQDRDLMVMDKTKLSVVTNIKPTEKDIESMLFAWRVVKHIKSNAILIAKNFSTIGIGAGQVSRVDAVDIALRKAGDQTKGAVLASDAFFPFRDSIDKMALTGIRAIIQPGGSMRDEEVISACNEHEIAMVFTGIRAFRH